MALSFSIFVTVVFAQTFTPAACAQQAEPKKRSTKAFNLEIHSDSEKLTEATVIIAEKTWDVAAEIYGATNQVGQQNDVDPTSQGSSFPIFSFEKTQRYVFGRAWWFFKVPVLLRFFRPGQRAQTLSFNCSNSATPLGLTR